MFFGNTTPKCRICATLFSFQSELESDEWTLVTVQQIVVTSSTIGRIRWKMCWPYFDKKRFEIFEQ
jgi:hypothetical protein